MKIQGFGNFYREEAGKFGFDWSFFVYAMEMAADEGAAKTKELHGDLRLTGRAIPVEIEVPDDES